MRWSFAVLALVCAGGVIGRAEALEIFVSNEKGNSISIIDGDTLELIETVPVGNRPRGIAISRDGRYLYICASDDDTIEVLETETREVLGHLPSGPDP
ncbi:MAG: beta-propeller fold lactonase family protein, partial [Geminicoccaceae bacterium]